MNVTFLEIKQKLFEQAHDLNTNYILKNQDGSGHLF